MGLLSDQYETLTDTSYTHTDKGLSLRLTIDDTLQQFAYELTKGHRKSVVVLDKDSGRVLALTGAYEEPFSLCNVTDEQLEAYRNAYEPVWLPEYLNTYHTGSVMKVFTFAVASDTGHEDFTMEDTGVAWFNGKAIYNAYDTTPKTETLHSAFVNSSNTFFSSLGVLMGADTLQTYIDCFLLNETIETDFGTIVNRSQLKKTPTNYQIASYAYGQGGSYSTISLAMLCQGALTGRIYKPHVIDSLYYEEGDEEVTVRKTEEEVLSQNIVSSFASENTLQAMQEAAAEMGLTTEGAGVKTGTAEIFDNHNANRATMIGVCCDKYLIAISELSDGILYGSSHRETMRQLMELLAQY